MTYSIYQDFDPLRVTVVGKSYPPEFYQWIHTPRLRTLFEKLAIETEEDYQNLIKVLQKFNVEVLRPELPKFKVVNKKFSAPPVAPRDSLSMIGTTMYHESPEGQFDFVRFYNNVRDDSWPDCNSIDELAVLPTYIQEECESLHKLSDHIREFENFQCSYSKIFDRALKKGNVIKKAPVYSVVGSMVNCLGKDRYFGTTDYNQDRAQLQNVLDLEFPETRNHVINTGGHLDGSYTIVCPGLIFSLKGLANFNQTHPGWEVIYLDGRHPNTVPAFRDLKLKNNGKWWIPGFEYDHELTELVESWFSHWTGYIDETVFDINLLVVDQKNVIVNQESDKVFKALSRYNITPHVVNFRHRHFWDSGTHCITADLHREGTMNNYFGV